MFKDSRIFIVFAILLLDAAVLGCIGPMLNEYLGDLPAKTFWLTGGTALMLGVQLAVSPALGYFTDKAGRRKGVLYTVAGTVFSTLILLVMQGWGYVVNRASRGVTSGLNAALRSSMTDISQKNAIVQTTGFYSFIASFGTILGPLVGGLLLILVPVTRQEPKYLVWLSVGLVMVNALLSRFYPETSKKETEAVKPDELKKKAVNALKISSLWQSLEEQDKQTKGLKAIFILNLVATLGVGHYTFFLAFLTGKDLDLKPLEISYFFLFFGTLGFIVNLFFYQFVVQHINKRVWLLGATLVGIGVMAGYALVGSSVTRLYWVAGLDALGVTLISGITGGILSELAAESEGTGESFGDFLALGGVASFVTALVNSFLSLVSFQAPFIFCGISLTVLAWLVYRLPGEARQKAEEISAQKPAEPTK